MASSIADFFKPFSNCTTWRKYLVDAYPFLNIMTGQLQYGQFISTLVKCATCFNWIKYNAKLLFVKWFGAVFKGRARTIIIV